LGTRLLEEINSKCSQSASYDQSLTSCRTSGEENLSEDIDQLFELTKIIVLVLSGLVPGLEESNSKGKLLLQLRKRLY
jgi:hypothetical protein